MPQAPTKNNTSLIATKTRAKLLGKRNTPPASEEEEEGASFAIAKGVSPEIRKRPGKLGASMKRKK